MMSRPFSITASLIVALLWVTPSALGGTVSQKEALDAAHHVRSIFEAKCLDCHGPELPRPKGKFGYVRDLKRIAENPDFVKKGDPDHSELFRMLESDEMPGDDANVPPLTAEEKAIVKHWIAIGAPHTLPPEEAKPVPAIAVAAAPAPDPAPTLPTWKRAIRWLGRFHPVSTHFPVALMYVAVLAEGMGWLTRRESWLQTVRFLVVLGALGAIMTATLGWINASFTSYVGASAGVLQWHRWLGTATTVWTIVCAGLALMADPREGSLTRQRLRGALIVGAVLVGVSGFLGSALIYGLNHYAW
jgi:uncharacterized membrane protein